VGCYSVVKTKKAQEKMQTTTIKYQSEPITLGLIRKDFDKCNSFLESLKLVDQLNRNHNTSVRLIRPEVADDILTREGYLRLLEEYSPFAVGAIVAHEERASGSYKSRPFNDKVRYHAPFEVSTNTSVIMITGRFKGETDAALVIMNPTLDDLTIDVDDKMYKRCPQGYSISKKVTIKVPDERIKQVKHFPSECGWYKPNGLAIPTGCKVEESRDARYLARFQKPVHHSGSLAWDPVIPYSGTYVGLVFRSALPEEDFYPAGKGIVMAPVDVKGIVVEIPNEDLEKLVEKPRWRKFVDFFR